MDGISTTEAFLFIKCFQFQLKTHLQAISDKKIAVGHQHSHGSMSSGLKVIFAEHGVLGLWRGATGALTRVMIGSAAQLSTFSTAVEYITKTKVISTSVLSNRESEQLYNFC